MSSEEIKEKKYDINEVLASGARGTVMKITAHQEKSVYAVKEIKILNADDLEIFQTELKLSQIGIPNILKCFGSHYDPVNNIFRFSTELMETDLFHLITEKKKKSISFLEFIPIFTDIVTGFFSFL